MSDSTRNELPDITEKAPSVYRIWQQVRAEGGTKPEMEDKYRELLEKYGHRSAEMRQW